MTHEYFSVEEEINFLIGIIICEKSMVSEDILIVFASTVIQRVKSFIYKILFSPYRIRNRRKKTN